MSFKYCAPQSSLSQLDMIAVRINLIRHIKPQDSDRAPVLNHSSDQLVIMYSIFISSDIDFPIKIFPEEYIEELLLNGNISQVKGSLNGTPKCYKKT